MILLGIAEAKQHILLTPFCYYDTLSVEPLKKGTKRAGNCRLDSETGKRR